MSGRVAGHVQSDEVSTTSGPTALPLLPVVASATFSGFPRPSVRVYDVERARAGDRAAFDDLVGRRLEPAFRTALGILGDEADARDATQDAFVSAWRRLPQLRDPERFDAWFSRILVNSCRGLRRARRRTGVREISVTSLPERDEPASADDPADERASWTDAIERAFGRLAVADRTILVLHHLDDRPLTEIAAALGVPVGTAKSRLFKARRSLEQALEAER